MSKTITISDTVFAKLESLARPFVDRSPEDVINRLIDDELSKDKKSATNEYQRITNNNTNLINRAPRERGVIVELNNKKISADTVPDLCSKVMEYLYSNKLWKEIEDLAPYKTSSKRYLFSKKPIHPNGKDFFVPIKYRNIYMEAHKNYQTTIAQLSRFLDRIDVNLVYKGM